MVRQDNKFIIRRDGSRLAAGVDLVIESTGRYR